MPYTHKEIICNHRAVLVADILQSKVLVQTSFEQITFAFIQEWISGKEEFKQHTSGSTGIPKEITLTRTQLLKSAHRTLQTLNLVAGDTALVCLDTKYIAGKMMVVRALEGDLKMVIIEPGSNPFNQLPEETLINFTALVPLQVQEIIADPQSKERLNQCKKVIVGGAAINKSLLASIKKLQCSVYATYGMTETVSHIALQKLNGFDASEYFTVLPAIQIHTDTRNCLVANIPEFKNPIITNDLIELISANQFRLLGRADNIINSGGYKIQPEKVESILESILTIENNLRSFFVAGRPDEVLGEKLVLVMEGEPISNRLTQLLKSEMSKQLHAYEIPKEIHYLPAFLRTETGKVNRKATLLALLR